MKDVTPCNDIYKCMDEVEEHFKVNGVTVIIFPKNNS